MEQFFALKLKQLLIKHEGYRTTGYLDNRGNITAGIGHNLSCNEISPDIIARWYDDDITYIHDKLLLQFQWFDSLDNVRKIAVLDLAFNVGFKNFCEFYKMISEIENKDYAAAAYELLDSDYAKQVPERAADLATILQKGVI